MKILKMKAFGDFDSPYDINICAGEGNRIEKIKEILNNFCKSLPGCEQDVSLSIYLADDHYFATLTAQLVNAGCFSDEKAKDFVTMVYNQCISSVYVYKDTFEAELITEI